MKQIFKLSIIMLALLLSIAPLADAKVKYQSHKKNSATSKSSPWSEIGRSNYEIWYLNTEIINFDVDGYPVVTVKQVPVKSYLETVRRENVNIYRDPKYKNYTHKLVQWKVDINQSRMKMMTFAMYAGHYLLEMNNCAAHPDADWRYLPYNSLGDQLIKVVRAAFM